MPDYELQCRGDGVRALNAREFKSNVKISSSPGIEPPRLNTKSVQVAEYKRREGDIRDGGETISYVVGRRMIGDGNVLAGVLLRLGQLELKRE